MCRIIVTSTAILTVLGLAACGEPGPKVGQPPETMPTTSPSTEASPEETLAVADDEGDEVIVEEPEPEEAVVETPELEGDFEYGETMVSLNEAYQMTAIGDWSIVRGEPQYPGYPEDQVLDPLELWVITHPEVEMQGEISLGTDFPQTASRPMFLLESMTEEPLPHLSSHYGNAYLVEGLFEVAGETIYRLSIVTDHREDQEISEIAEYYGDRTPAPRFFFVMHFIDSVGFEEYRDSQARQDLLQMLRTLQIEDPPYFEEGVDLEHLDQLNDAA